MTLVESGHTVSWKALNPSMSNLRLICLVLIGGVALVILVDIMREGPTASVVLPKVVVEHRHVQIGSNATERSNAAWQYNWDMRSWKNPADGANVPTRTLILIRHGQYDFSTGLLNEIGRAQAELTGRRLQALGLKYDIMHHSTMVRAVETARIVHSFFPNVSLIADDSLQEGGPVQPKPTINYWKLSDEQYHIDGPRMEGGFRKYFYRASIQQRGTSHEIIVAHGNICRFFVLRSLQLPAQAWMRLSIAHASITFIHISSDGIVTLTRLGDSGHLPPDKVTF